MSVCTFYLRSREGGPTLQEIKSRLAGSVDEKPGAIRDLIRCMINEDGFPPIIMHIITHVIPHQHKSPQLRKAMLLYWEIIEKSKSATDQSLKEEVFLACNSLRNDLIGHNQYVRGRTLRLVSRIMHKGVIEPLASAITANLVHKSAYVRRNAVVCMYNVFMHFGSDVIGDVDEEVLEVLEKESDLSTKRNAFLLLNKSAPKQAMNYLQTQVKNQATEEIGDILQLAILKVIKARCREDPSQRGRLLRIVNSFLEKGTDAVRLECALTATAISNSAGSIKGALSVYVGILARTTQINVKKIILDKLELICRNSNYLEEDQLDDLLQGLATPSPEVKAKIIDIIMSAVSHKSAQSVLQRLAAEKIMEQSQLTAKIMTLLELVTHKYPPAHTPVVRFISENVLFLKELDTHSAMALSNVFKIIYSRGNKDSQLALTQLSIHSLSKIGSSQFSTIILEESATHLQDSNLIEEFLEALRGAIGPMPLQPTQDDSEEGQKLKKKGLREFLLEDSIVGGVFARSVVKLLYRIRQSGSFTRLASNMLVIFCGLLRTYQSNLAFVDQAVIDQLTLIIRRVLDPVRFIKTKDPLFENKLEEGVELTFREKRQEVIEKNPEDMVQFRLLKRGEQGGEDEVDQEEEVNDILQQAPQRIDYVGRLKSVVQLTGCFDPLYAQAFVRVSKYDLFFDILLINTTKTNLLNIQLEFTSSAEVIVLEKAQCVNLRAYEWVRLRTQLRFSAGQFGVVYGFINYDSGAGLEQPYLITEQISIDYMQFVEPAEITASEFTLEWSQTGNELTYETTIPNKLDRTFRQIIQVYEKMLHGRLVEEVSEQGQQYFLNCHLFGKSKLGQNFLINLALFQGQETHLSATIRSRDKAVSDIIHKELLKRKFSQQEE